VARVCGPEAYLFGIDLSTARFNELCDARGIGKYNRNQAVMLDGLKIQPEHTLEPDRINAVVAVPGWLEIKPTILCLEGNRPPDTALQSHPNMPTMFAWIWPGGHARCIEISNLTSPLLTKALGISTQVFETILCTRMRRLKF
jgi:hypothetical protein